MHKHLHLAGARRLQPSLLTIALLSALCVPAVQAQTSSAASASSGPAAAQTATSSTSSKKSSTQKSAADAKKVSTLSTVTVSGILSTLETSNSKKRDATVVSDVLSTEDIGNMPAVNIGDAMDTITGVATYIAKGAASEVSIRGLGPYLGKTTFNDREVTSANGSRSVNFSLYPSAVINTVAVYKTQRADFIEGGVSGIINLQTVKPLDSSKRGIQVDLQGNYNALDSKTISSDRYGIGSRATISYVDQFNLGDAGELGVALTLQRNRSNDPQDTLTSNSSVGTCNPLITSSGKCTPVTAAQVAAGTPYYLIQSSRTYRAMTTTDSTDAAFGTVQWKPNDRLEIDLDYEGSQRDFLENRHDFGISSSSTNIHNVVASDTGVLQSYAGTSPLSSVSNYYTRDESYKSGGLTVKWTPNEAWLVTGDLSYSDSQRTQTQLQTTLKTSGTDIYGNKVAGYDTTKKGVDYTYDYVGNIPTININPAFNINNWDAYNSGATVARTEAQTKNTINALRLDTSFFPESGFLTTIKGGVRLSGLNYSDFTNTQTFSYTNTALIEKASLACRTPFPESDFLGGASGNTITSWATFNSKCLFKAFTGVADTGLPSNVQSPANNNVTENTGAAYLMAEYGSNLFGLPVTGNFGVRLVHTTDTSIGLRSALNVVNNADGTIQLVPTGAFTSNAITASHNTFLPSFNAAFALNDDTLLRLGLYRAMSRPDPDSLGSGRTITLANGSSFTSIADAISGITATGNPRSDPLLSWNADLSLEWYPNPTSLLSGAVYFKRFNGASVSTVVNEPFVINGDTLSVPVTEPTTSSQKSNLVGLELNASQRFSFLPAPFDGLGAKLSFNYNHSNYQTQDLQLGAIENPTTGVITPGIVSPLGMYGMSRDVLSSSLFYTIGPIDLQAIYTYRSSEFQQFVGVPHQNRLQAGMGALSFRASWQVNPHLSFSLEGSNLTNQAQISYMPINGVFYEYDTYGRQYYIDARYRF